MLAEASQSFCLSLILRAEALLTPRKRVLDIEDPAPPEQPETMFHLHLHNLCEVLETG